MKINELNELTTAEMLEKEKQFKEELFNLRFQLATGKFVPLRDCACADHLRPSLSPALLSGWSSHLVNPYTFAQSID